jgi:hypothetical protein
MNATTCTSVRDEYAARRRRPAAHNPLAEAEDIGSLSSTLDSSRIANLGELDRLTS